MAAPRSNGAIVEDETPTSNVSVDFNFSNTGTGGVLQVLQSEDIDSINSGYPAANDPRWVDAVDVNGNAPPSGAQAATWSHYGFRQPRGTARYYYCRRKNGSTIELGSPYPVMEIVPSQPFIGSVDHNSLFTEATVRTDVSDGYTTLYYHQNTTGVRPVWEAESATQTEPNPTLWQQSPTFNTVPDESYYYYALGWTHNNPAQDGACISTVTSRTASDGYGLEVWNASQKKIVSMSDRLIRFFSHGTVTGNSTGYVDVPTAGMANNDTWGVSLGNIPMVFEFSTARPMVSFAKQNNNLRIYIPNSQAVQYYVFRT